ncbi:amidohydrolase family protein [Sphingomonas sp. LY54]|uniref:amidohydrolase n=1 Tax=Sphingomonas sp. LY54 TaxID=3095343 RepID=UPI002D7784D9|nr:amidohydrolase family protein [Sphingomonas sp. LY54]WRP27481.1 amidohydrolase family protein [Sphingomonas sp. LY54]
MKKLLAAAAALFCVQTASADTLIDNVNGYTISGKDEVTRFNGLVIGTDGRVKQLLARKDKRPERPDYKLDGKGRTMIPGLIDAHGHVMGLGMGALQLDLSDTNSLQEAQAKIAAFARANPSPRWIIGRGWNQEKWGLGRFPTAADIDAVVADRPVWLDRVDGHAGWANSLAMREAGVTAASKSPPGGKIEMTGSQPSGIFIDAAAELVQKSVPAPLPRIRERALDRAQEILLSHGITTAADMGTSGEDWEVMRRSGDKGRLQLRVLSYAAGVENLLAVAGTEPTPWLYDGRLRMVGVKLYSDGALGSRGAWLKQPYKDSPKERGLAFLNDAALKNLMSRAAMDGFQVAVHAIGDAANAQLLEAVEELSDTYKGDRRWRVEHAQIVDPADLPRFARNGIIASMQPVHESSDWRMAEARMGRERLGGAYAWQSMIRNGVPLAFGSDFPVESPNPFHGLAVAVSREDAQGQPPGGWMPEQKVSMAQAFAGFTRGGAYAAFAEDRLGTLERGKYADFLFIDRDIFAATPAEVRATQVLETWIGGRQAWKRK